VGCRVWVLGSGVWTLPIHAVRFAPPSQRCRLPRGVEGALARQRAARRAREPQRRDAVGAGAHLQQQRAVRQGT
jgi:hypothetical protein